MSVSSTVIELRKKERIRKRSSANAVAFGNLCLALNEDSLSRTELAELTGLSDGCIRTWIAILRIRELIYICEYRRRYSVGRWEEVFKWGFKKHDVLRPKKKTQAQYSANYRTRKLLKETLYGISRTNQESSSDLS